MVTIEIFSPLEFAAHKKCDGNLRDENKQTIVTLESLNTRVIVTHNK